MPNANSPYGLQAVSDASGRPYSGAGTVYYVPAANATALYLGDPLLVLDNSADANGVPAIGIATAGASNYITGAMLGRCNSAGELILPLVQSDHVYLPVSTAGYILVADDPNTLFLVQENGGMVAGAASRNASLVAGAGSTVTGFSGWQLNSSTLNTTNTLQMRILRASQSIDNAVGTNAKWLCKINLHSMLNQTGV